MTIGWTTYKSGDNATKSVETDSEGTNLFRLSTGECSPISSAYQQSLPATNMWNTGSGGFATLGAYKYTAHMDKATPQWLSLV